MKYLKNALFSLIFLCSLIPSFGNDLDDKAEKLAFEKKGVYKCGRQPKQVLFSPDDKCIVLPLLEDNGFQVFDLVKECQVKMINPPRSKKQGFAEGLFIKEKNSFFVSQMTTGYIYEYEYNYPDFTFKREIYTEGTWSKFIAWSSEKHLLAVSNWVSNDVSLIDYDTGTVVKKLKTAEAPRGLAFVSGGKEIIVLCFDGGKIQKFNVETGNLVDSIYIQNSAMRHIVINDYETKAYISDMYHASVYELDLMKFKVTSSWKVFNNPNTISLYKGRWLFVSCRGPNNKQDYTKRSPVNGRVIIIDTTDRTENDIIYGGNQPTGLSLSSDGKLLCFSNFQDANIELYSIYE
ncbi:MAG: YVTN family beta-propeller repeat-containing protein [Treponema sp.]|nr:YVTN family beta-propeller repeat-containing protein [Treponema sp.]